MSSGDERSVARAPVQLGSYEVLLPIASGGMGSVYLGRPRGRRGAESLVAIKVMHVHLREDPNFATELLGEAKLAGMIHHPNVVSVLDADEDRDGVFLVMDYVEGDTLGGLRKTLGERDDYIPERIGLRILVDALWGLHAAHELRDGDTAVGLVHRDFTPQNILVGVDGVSRLTDFGVAKAANRTSYTATGLIKGKLHYMPPEQARSDPLDRRSDIWSAGVMLWEILARARMYTDRNDTAVLLQLITEEPPPLKSVRPEISDAFDELCRWALTREPEDRCPSAEVMADAIVAAAEEGEGLATAAEVGRFVRQLAGEELAERQKRIDQVRASFAPAALASPESEDDAPPPDDTSPVHEPSTFEPTNTSRRPEELARTSRWRPLVGVALGALLVVGATESYRAYSGPGGVGNVAHPATGPHDQQPPRAVDEDEPVVSARDISLVSEVPMTTVVVGARRLSFPEAESRVDLTLTAEETTLDHIEVEAIDGRRSKVKLSDADEIEVDFTTPPPATSR